MWIFCPQRNAMHAAGGFAEAAGTELCKGCRNVEENADVELDWHVSVVDMKLLVFHWKFNIFMFLALQHSAGHATIHDLVARAMFLEAAVPGLRFYYYLFPKFIGYKGIKSLVYCHCSCILLNKIRIFDGGNNSILRNAQCYFSRVDDYLSLQLVFPHSPSLYPCSLHLVRRVKVIPFKDVFLSLFKLFVVVPNNAVIWNVQ